MGISVENIIPVSNRHTLRQSVTRADGRRLSQQGDEDEEEKSAKKKDSKKSKNLGRRSTRTRKHISYRPVTPHPGEPHVWFPV